jgi:hypothetical protein
MHIGKLTPCKQIETAIIRVLLTRSNTRGSLYIYIHTYIYIYIYCLYIYIHMERRLAINHIHIYIYIYILIIYIYIYITSPRHHVLPEVPCTARMWLRSANETMQSHLVINPLQRSITVAMETATASIYFKQYILY